MAYSREIIEKQTEDWATSTFGPTFKFRKGQKESIVTTIYAWLTGTENVIANMPTGSGKSIYAMIVAGVLIDYYDKRGYILCSDLGLLDQYARDIDRYLPRWTVLKGQQEYQCTMNGMPFTAGTCKLMGCKTYKDIAERYHECSESCPYLCARQHAIRSKLTVMTYPLWLMQQNLVKKRSENPPFDERDFTICDEAHKLIGIVQDHFSPRFGSEDMNKFTSILNYTSIGTADDTLYELRNLRDSVLTAVNNDEVFEILKKYTLTLAGINDTVDDARRTLGEELKKKGRLSKEKKSVLYAMDFLNDTVIKFADYIETIADAGTDYIIVNDAEDGKTVTFNCMNETHLMDRYFHDQCRNRLYMSATIGDPDVFIRDLGIITAEKIVLPSTFDFTNSPIYFTREYSLSYRNKDVCLPRVAELITSACRLYPNYRGIIQTGSYVFAKQLFDMVPFDVKRRMLLYNGSAEKSSCLDTYKQSPDKILVGPSLIEGISLDDDLCRFQIVMKIPYPSLRDKYVAAKMKFNPQWYSNTTAISILQGIGRGVRSEHDWCVTFIFDSCFMGLLERSYSMFPEEFMKRIQVIPANTLVY